LTPDKTIIYDLPVPGGGQTGRSRENFHLSQILLTDPVLHGPLDAVTISLITGALKILAGLGVFIHLVINQTAV
jgi:hypothetical protein